MSNIKTFIYAIKIKHIRLRINLTFPPADVEYEKFPYPVSASNHTISFYIYVRKYAESALKRPACLLTLSKTQQEKSDKRA